MGARSKRKGRTGELELAAELNRLGYHSVKAGECSSYGQEPDISGLRGIHIECKRVERLNVHAAMKQSISDARKFRDGYPAVFHRRNREPWLVTMRLNDWNRLYNATLRMALQAHKEERNMPARRTPPAIICYRDGDCTRYVSHLTLDEAKEAVKDYFERQDSDPGSISFFVDPAHADKYSDELKAIADEYGVCVPIFAIGPGVLFAANHVR